MIRNHKLAEIRRRLETGLDGEPGTGADTIGWYSYKRDVAYLLTEVERLNRALVKCQVIEERRVLEQQRAAGKEVRDAS